MIRPMTRMIAVQLRMKSPSVPCGAWPGAPPSACPGRRRVTLFRAEELVSPVNYYKTSQQGYNTQDASGGKCLPPGQGQDS